MEDLRALIRQNISIDMATFKKLQKEAWLVWPREGRGRWGARGVGSCQGEGRVCGWVGVRGGGATGRVGSRGWAQPALKPGPAPQSGVAEVGSVGWGTVGWF